MSVCVGVIVCMFMCHRVCVYVYVGARMDVISVIKVKLKLIKYIILVLIILNENILEV